MRVLRSHLGLVIAGFFAVTILIYGWSVVHNDFVNFDDGLLITRNEIVQEFSPRTITLAFTSFDPELYIPLTFLSYQVDHLIGGLNPIIFHLTNVLLHTLNALLLAGVVLLIVKNRWIAVVTGLLFAVHPLHTEAVVWASSRKDLLYTFFFLLSLGSFLMSRERSSSTWYWMSVLFFLLSLLAKVSAITLPIAILLIDWGRGRSIFNKRTAMELLPLVALCVVFVIIASLGKVGTGELLFEKMLIGARATAFYLQKLIVPTGLSVLYPFTKPISLGTPELLISLIVVAVITVVTVSLQRRTRIPLALWLFFLVMIYPSFGNFAKGQEHFRDIYFASDRYAYVASMSILLGAALLFYVLRLRHKRVADGLIALILIVFGFLAFHQSRVWRDTESLFRHVLRHYPNSQLAHNFIGASLYEQGDVPGALAAYNASVTVRPNNMGYFNIGVIHEREGRVLSAIASYKRAIEIHPGDMDARINLGVIFLRMEKNAEAATLFQEAIDAAPLYTSPRNLKTLLALAYYNLGEANFAMRKLPEAAAAYAKAAEIDPTDVESKEKAEAMR